MIREERGIPAGLRPRNHRRCVASCPKRRGWRDEGGYTIVESVIALSLLVTVLVPLTATLSYFVSQRRSEELAEALALGRHQMESMLSAAEEVHDDVRVADDTWRVARSTLDEAGLRVYSVDVYHADRLLLELDTARRRP